MRIGSRATATIAVAIALSLPLAFPASAAIWGSTGHCRSARCPVGQRETLDQRPSKTHVRVLGGVPTKRPRRGFPRRFQGAVLLAELQLRHVRIHDEEERTTEVQARGLRVFYMLLRVAPDAPRATHRHDHVPAVVDPHRRRREQRNSILGSDTGMQDAMLLRPYTHECRRLISASGPVILRVRQRR